MSAAKFDHQTDQVEAKLFDQVKHWKPDTFLSMMESLQNGLTVGPAGVDAAWETAPNSIRMLIFHAAFTAMFRTSVTHMRSQEVEP